MAAVCHGPAALTEAELNREPLVKGKKVTACYASCQQICQRLCYSVAHLSYHIQCHQIGDMQHVSCRGTVYMRLQWQLLGLAKT